MSYLGGNTLQPIFFANPSEDIFSEIYHTFSEPQTTRQHHLLESTMLFDTPIGDLNDPGMVYDTTSAQFWTDFLASTNNSAGGVWDVQDQPAADQRLLEPINLLDHEIPPYNIFPTPGSSVGGETAFVPSASWLWPPTQFNFWPGSFQRLPPTDNLGNSSTPLLPIHLPAHPPIPPVTFTPPFTTPIMDVPRFHEDANFSTMASDVAGEGIMERGREQNIASTFSGYGSAPASHGKRVDRLRSSKTPYERPSLGKPRHSEMSVQTPGRNMVIRPSTSVDHPFTSITLSTNVLHSPQKHFDRTKIEPFTTDEYHAPDSGSKHRQFIQADQILTEHSSEWSRGLPTALPPLFLENTSPGFLANLASEAQTEERPLIPPFMTGNLKSESKPLPKKEYRIPKRPIERDNKKRERLLEWAKELRASIAHDVLTHTGSLPPPMEKLDVPKEQLEEIWRQTASLPYTVCPSGWSLDKDTVLQGLLATGFKIIRNCPEYIVLNWYDGEMLVIDKYKRRFHREPWGHVFRLSDFEQKRNKTYGCLFGCGYQSETQSGRGRHMQGIKHTPKRLHCCDHCGHSFTRADSRQRHQEKGSCPGLRRRMLKIQVVNTT